MTDDEGVIKYHLQFQSGPAPDARLIRELNAWRNILYSLRMLGRDKHRYGGYDYGNVSRRCQQGSNQFIISGTQTAHIAQASAQHYVLVKECDPFNNKLTAEGLVKPSSEALTHGAVYEADSGIQFVFHVHCPPIWNNAAVLQVPGTAENISYGTPEMAQQIQRLISNPGVKNGLIIKMTGHEDGIISFGETAEQAGITLIKYLSRALQI